MLMFAGSTTPRPNRIGALFISIVFLSSKSLKPFLIFIPLNVNLDFGSTGDLYRGRLIEVSKY